MSDQNKLPDLSDPDSPRSQAERRSRMRLERNNLIEDLIAAGREQGVFDNLPGSGKPLNLKKNLFAPELDLAHSLLKDNEMVPAWISERNELLVKIKTLRTAVQTGWQRHKRAFALQPADQDRISLRWYDTCRVWDEEIRLLNKKIDRFNLKRPIQHLELFKLDLDHELQRVGGMRWLRPDPPS